MITKENLKKVQSWVNENTSYSAGLDKENSAYFVKHLIQFDTGVYLTEQTTILIFESMGIRARLQPGGFKTFFFCYFKKAALKPRTFKAAPSK
jgi:hypothetical protein